jgi:hypothetical protein
MDVVSSRGGLYLLFLGVTGTAAVLDGELGWVAQLVWACVISGAIGVAVVVRVRHVLRVRASRRSAGGPPGFLDEFRQAVDLERAQHLPQVGRGTVAPPAPPVSNEGAQDE